MDMNIVDREITDRQGRKFLWRGPEDGLSGTFVEVAEKRSRGQAAMIKDAQDLEMRDDDIMICTYVKTGTHWVWEMVSMVLKEAAEYDKRTKEVAMLEFQTPSKLETLTSPRILNTHLPANRLPSQVITKKVKVIHVTRNPKDVAVSWYYFAKNLPMLLPLMDKKPFETFSECLPYFTGEYGVFFPSSIFDYCKKMEKFITSYPDQTLHLYFEDMKKNPVDAVEQIAKFLNKNLSKSLIAEIAENCSFKNLKKANDTVKERPTVPMVTDAKIETGHMYRKGEVGDWKNHFTVAESEHFDKLLEEHFKDSKWKWTFSSS